jgi:hypothetical protein
VGAVICDWKGWGKHLISLLLPDAATLNLAPLQDPVELMAKVVASRGHAPDLIVMHVDNTFPAQVFPGVAEFATYAERAGIPVWNHLVRDISKRAVHAHNAQHGLRSTAADWKGNASERLIIKTNLNHHGVTESNVTMDERRILGWSPYATTPINPWPDYPIMCRADIPTAWWTDPRLYIERFIWNSENALYRMYFAGEHCVLRLGTSPMPVLRLADSHQHSTYRLLRELANDPMTRMLLGPRASSVFTCATRFAQSFSLDYGTVDLVADDSNDAYVIDANVCPFWGADDSNGDTQFITSHLAAGIARHQASSLRSGGTQ